MNDIQKARDVLAKWRDASPSATRQKWFVSFKDEHGWVDIAVQDGGIIDGGSDEGAVHADLAPLIVGTAGNPDLLDAIDGVLEAAVRLSGDSPGTPHRLVQHARRIAAAIIAADDRMRA